MGFINQGAAPLILCSLLCSCFISSVHGSRRTPRAQQNVFLPKTGVSMPGQAADLGVLNPSTEGAEHGAPPPAASLAYSSLRAADRKTPLRTIRDHELVTMKDWRLRALWVSITGQEPIIKKPLKHLLVGSSSCTTDVAQPDCKRLVNSVQQKRRLSSTVQSPLMHYRSTTPSTGSSSSSINSSNGVYEEEARQVPGGPDPLHHSDQPTSP